MKNPATKTTVIAIGGNLIVFGVCALCYAVWDVNLVPVMVISLLLTVMTIVLAKMLEKKSGGDLRALERVMAVIDSEGHSEKTARDLLEVYESGWSGNNRLIVGASCADELDTVGLTDEAEKVLAEIIPLTEEEYKDDPSVRSYCAEVWLTSFSLAEKRGDKLRAGESYEKYSAFIQPFLSQPDTEDTYKTVSARYKTMCGEYAEAEEIFLSKQELAFQDLCALTQIYIQTKEKNKALQAAKSASELASDDTERSIAHALMTEIKDSKM